MAPKQNFEKGHMSELKRVMSKKGPKMHPKTHTKMHQKTHPKKGPKIKMLLN